MVPIQITAEHLAEMEPHDQKNVLALVEELATTALDSARGYDLAALRTRDHDLRDVFQGLALRRRSHAVVLSGMLHGDRRERAAHGTTLAALHRGLLELRTKLDHGSATTILGECERSEHVALERYELGLRERLPRDIADILVDQASEIRDSHAALDHMRQP